MLGLVAATLGCAKNSRVRQASKKLSQVLLQHDLQTFSSFFFKVIRCKFFDTSTGQHSASKKMRIRQHKSGATEISGVQQIETSLTFDDLTQAVWSAARGGVCNFGSPCPIEFLHSLLWREGIHTTISSLRKIIDYEPVFERRQNGFIMLYENSATTCDCRRCTSVLA